MGNDNLIIFIVGAISIIATILSLWMIWWYLIVKGWVNRK